MTILKNYSLTISGSGGILTHAVEASLNIEVLRVPISPRSTIVHDNDVAGSHDLQGQTRIDNEARAKLVPEISQNLRSIPQSFPISPEQGQNRLFEAVSQFVTNISKETPLLVVLDDLQWTDPSSLLLLHHLAVACRRRAR